MPWSTITLQDVLDEFTPLETATLQALQGSTTPLPGILAKTLKKVRSAINAGGNQLDQTGLTVPDSLVDEVIAIARWRWLSSFPALKSLKTTERKEAADNAMKLLERLSSQDADRPRTELPAVVDATPVPLTQPSFGRVPHREFNKRNQDG